MTMLDKEPTQEEYEEALRGCISGMFKLGIFFCIGLLYWWTKTWPL